MIDVQLTVQSMPDIDAWTPGLRSALEGALPAMAEVLRESADSCFENQADPHGNAWAPTQRQAREPGARILIDRAILRGSIAPQLDVPNLTARVAPGGAAAAYAGVHQWGSEDGTTPARPYLSLEGNPDSPTVNLPPEVHAEVVATAQDAIDRWAAQTNAAR